MKKVYIQIIDPLNGMYVNACHEYSNDNTQALETTLRYYNLSLNEDYKTINSTGHELPGMPEYLLIQGLEKGTSKLVQITIVG